LDIGGVLSAVDGSPATQLINVLTYNLGVDFSRRENLLLESSTSDQESTRRDE
jgi:hypothetical protein